MSSKYAKLALHDAADDEHEQQRQQSGTYDKRRVHSAASDMVAVDMNDSPRRGSSTDAPSPFVASQLHPQLDGSSVSSIDGDESSQLMDSESDGGRNGSQSQSRPAGLIVLDEQPPSDDEVRITCMRLGGTGHGSVQLNAPLDSTVRQLISRAYSHELQELHQRVRILFCGRMLRDEDVLSACGIKHECVLHAHITDAPPVGFQQADAQPQQLVGGDGAAHPHPALEVIDLESGNLNGFDPTQYSAEQLNTLRQAQLDLEREMMQPIGPREGNNSDLILGVFLGFVLGWLAILCLYSPALSRKHRLGLLLGLTLNLCMLILNYIDPAPTSDTQQPFEEVIDPREGAEGVSNS